MESSHKYNHFGCGSAAPGRPRERFARYKRMVWDLYLKVLATAKVCHYEYIFRRISMNIGSISSILAIGWLASSMYPTSSRNR